MKFTTLIFYLFICLIFANCSSNTNLLGKYYNKCIYFDMPKTILTLDKEKYTLVYPTVIGEKEEGIWENRNDSIFLYMKYEIINNLKDTIKVNKEPIIYIKKNSKLYKLKEEHECFLVKKK
jgi:hypothetical protein